jgi:hypothetical protein
MSRGIFTHARAIRTPAAAETIAMGHHPELDDPPGSGITSSRASRLPGRYARTRIRAPSTPAESPNQGSSYTCRQPAQYTNPFVVGKATQT